MSTSPRVIELTDRLFPVICYFFMQREQKGRPRASTLEINTYLKEQSDLGAVRGLTFRGTSGTYTYQGEYAITNLVARGLLEEERGEFWLSEHGKEAYRKKTAKAPRLEVPTCKALSW